MLFVGSTTPSPPTSVEYLIIAAGGGGGADVAGEGTAASGAGGSGVVIFRYADTFAAATSTTGSPTVTVTGGFRIYTFTGSGSVTF
jgi:hypothetical protein